MWDDENLNPPETIKQLFNAVQRLMQSLSWLAPPPGAFIAVLALVAILYGFIQQPSAYLRVIFIAVCGLLAFAEIFVAYWARAKQDRAYVEQTRRIDDMRQAADLHHEAMLRRLLAINEPAEGLKKRALQFSESLLAFLYDRLQHAPKERPYYAASGGNWPPQASLRNLWEGAFEGTFEAMKQAQAYETDTLQMYAHRFGKQVYGLREEFLKHGLTDQQLDSAYLAVKGPQDIRLIAERIGNLAEQLEATRDPISAVN